MRQQSCTEIWLDRVIFLRIWGLKLSLNLVDDQIWLHSNIFRQNGQHRLIAFIWWCRGAKGLLINSITINCTNLESLLTAAKIGHTDFKLISVSINCRLKIWPTFTKLKLRVYHKEDYLFVFLIRSSNSTYFSKINFVLTSFKCVLSIYAEISNTKTTQTRSHYEKKESHWTRLRMAKVWRRKTRDKFTLVTKKEYSKQFEIPRLLLAISQQKKRGNFIQRKEVMVSGLNVIMGRRSNSNLSTSVRSHSPSFFLKQLPLS